MNEKLHSTLRVLICLLLCAVAASLCACGAESEKSSAPTEDGVLTAVRNESGEITGYERRYHNDDGNITRLDSYDADQNYLTFVLFTYDDAGRLYTETFYVADGFAESRNIYTYDDDGRLSEKAIEYPHGEATVEHYDANGSVYERLYYGTDEQLSYSEKLENGAWVRYEPTEPASTDATE